MAAKAYIVMNIPEEVLEEAFKRVKAGQSFVLHFETHFDPKSHIAEDDLASEFDRIPKKAEVKLVPGSEIQELLDGKT